MEVLPRSDVNTVSSTQRPATVWFHRHIVITMIFYRCLYYSKYIPTLSVKLNADADIRGCKCTSSYWEKWICLKRRLVIKTVLGKPKPNWLFSDIWTTQKSQKKSNASLSRMYAVLMIGSDVPPERLWWPLIPVGLWCMHWTEMASYDGQITTSYDNKWHASSLFQHYGSANNVCTIWRHRLGFMILLLLFHTIKYVRSVIKSVVV